MLRKKSYEGQVGQYYLQGIMYYNTMFKTGNLEHKDLQAYAFLSLIIKQTVIWGTNVHHQRPNLVEEISGLDE